MIWAFRAGGIRNVWVDVPTAIPVEVRLYEGLFTPDIESFDDARPIESYVSPTSLVVRSGFVERSLADLPVGAQVQFERTGYFAVDSDSVPGHLVFNRTAGLRETKFAQVMKGAKKA